MTFQQADYIPNKIISSSAIQAAFALYDAGKYVGAWTVLAKAGDRYAEKMGTPISRPASSE